MKITDIKTYTGPSEQFLVKVETDTELFGWGEAGFGMRALAVDGAVQHFRQLLLGEDPMEIGAHWQRLYRSHYFEGGRVLTCAMSGIDIALHDLAGKALGVPVYQLLGGKQRDFIPCFATTLARSLDQLISEGQLLMDQGWKVIRTWIGFGEVEAGGQFEPRESLALTAEWLTALREAVGLEAVGGIHLTGVRRDPHQCSAADRHGRFAPGRSRLVGCPRRLGGSGGSFLGRRLAMRSWKRIGSWATASSSTR